MCFTKISTYVNRLYRLHHVGNFFMIREGEGEGKAADPAEVHKDNDDQLRKCVKLCGKSCGHADGADGGDHF